jgi:hypothetical protein
MPRHVGIGPVDHRLVKAGLGDPGLEIVADRLAGDAAEISEGADICRNPIRQLLAPSRLGVGEARCAQHGDKNLYRYDLTGEAIDDLAGAAGEVDKQLLAGEMGLAHCRLQPARPTPVKVAEPGIAEPVGRTSPVLLPQQRQGHIGAAQLAMHPGPVGHRALIGGDRRRRREQQRFQLLVIEICGQGPAHARGAGPAEIAAHCRLAQPQALRYPPLRQLAGKPQSQNFADLAHRHSLGRHLVPPADRQRSETTLG